VVHLQSGHGLEDAALVQADAKSVIGVDYSAVAAGAARQRADELGLACRYIVGTVPGVPLADGTADLVYTEKGALIWMPDLDAWASEAARLLRPGGHLFVYEGHPAVPLWTWDEDSPGISVPSGLRPRPRSGPGPARRGRQGWHAFILHTDDYAEFCQRVAGRFIHHLPAGPGRGQRRRRDPRDRDRDARRRAPGRHRAVVPVRRLRLQVPPVPLRLPRLPEAGVNLLTR
jgi:SAM-dependent methyltransferase